MTDTSATKRKHDPKSAPAPDQDSSSGDKAAGNAQNAFNTLVKKGRTQGYLTYDEINSVLPDDMLTASQLDETLLLFDDYDIEIIDEKDSKHSGRAKKVKERAARDDDSALADFGSVTDPVKMYLREMGLVTLLSRDGEVEIAKKIEAGEQEVLRALIDTTTAVNCLLELGRQIGIGVLRPKYVLRDIDEGETLVDEVLQIDNFLETMRSIQKVHDENTAYRERLFSQILDPAEQRRIRRCITRRSNKIFYHLESWRLESSLVDRIEKIIREQIEWFDSMNKLITGCAESLDASIKDLRSHLEEQESFSRWIQPRCQLSDQEIVLLFEELNTVLNQILIRENAIKARSRTLKRIMANVDEGRLKAKAAKSELTKSQFATGCQHCQKIHQPRLAIPGFDPGRQHWSDEGGGQIRIPAGIQVQYICHLVDSSGHHPGHCRSGPNHPYSGTHDRDHQQADPHIALPGPGTGS